MGEQERSFGENYCRIRDRLAVDGNHSNRNVLHRCVGIENDLSTVGFDRYLGLFYLLDTVQHRNEKAHSRCANSDRDHKPDRHSLDSPAICPEWVSTHRGGGPAFVFEWLYPSGTEVYERLDEQIPK